MREGAPCHISPFSTCSAYFKHFTVQMKVSKDTFIDIDCPLDLAKEPDTTS
jgi:hypothetical protein